MTKFAVGSLVEARGREWVVLPASTDELLVLRPLAGTEDDVAAVFPELEDVAAATFPPPDPDDLGDFRRASLLRDALRIGFRASAGPFRSLAALAVEPRPYQLVPLLMALRQEVVRLLIADDVGIGKTIEAGLVAAEVLAQGDARGLTVLCGPALAEQWQEELRTKFGIPAELVLPSTVTRLERGLIGTESLYTRYSNLVVSTDFIKSPRRRADFVHNCADLVIVDEAHTCVAADNRAGRGRMQRYELLTELAKDPDRHLILVTATPHSGKEESFRNLLGLLDPELAELDLDLAKHRERLARHFVQRRRGDIRDDFHDTDKFPSDRETKEVSYLLTDAYDRLFRQVLDFAREQARDATGGQLRQRIRWWSALALLRALASSPRAAAATLRTRAAAAEAETSEEADVLGRATVLDYADDEAVESIDVTPGADTEEDGAASPLRRRLLTLARQADALENAEDAKLKTVTRQLKALLAEGFQPIVFCRFIHTAEYLAEYLKGKLGRQTAVAAVTGSLPPTERQARIAELVAESRSHVLVATDCLSEGINLQEHFQAVVHYDLAWNPTRHEQREGRVDRFGQRSQVVRAVTMYGANNGIDGIVLNVLIKKHKEIREATGVSVPVPAESDSVLEALMEGVLLRNQDYRQGTLDLLVEPEREALHRDWDSAADREKASNTKYAQRAIKPAEVYEQLHVVRAALGSNEEVAGFVRSALHLLGAVIEQFAGVADGPEFTARTGALPPALLETLPPRRPEPLPFRPELPAPRGAVVLNRTDPVVSALARYVLDAALDSTLDGHVRPARRCGVIRTRSVPARTTLLLARYRFQLTLPSRTGDKPMVAEDAQLLAFRGRPANADWLNDQELRQLLVAEPDANIPLDQQRPVLTRVIDALPAMADALDAHGEELATRLRAQHRAVRESAGAVKRNLRVEVQKPADVLGVYVYLPVVEG